MYCVFFFSSANYWRIKVHVCGEFVQLLWLILVSPPVFGVSYLGLTKPVHDLIPDKQQETEGWMDQLDWLVCLDKIKTWYQQVLVNKGLDWGQEAHDCGIHNTMYFYVQHHVFE